MNDLLTALPRLALIVLLPFACFGIGHYYTPSTESNAALARRIEALENRIRGYENGQRELREEVYGEEVVRVEESGH